MSQNDRLVDLLKSVLYLQDIAQVRHAFKDLPFSTEEIEEALTRIEEEFIREKRHSHRALLAHVRQDWQKSARRPNKTVSSSVTDPASLIIAARRCQTALRAWRFFRRHHQIAGAIDTNSLLKSSVTAREFSATQEGIRLAYALALAVGDRRSEAMARMAWSTLYRRAGRLEPASRHANRAAEMAAGLDDVALTVMALGNKSALQRVSGDRGGALSTLRQSLEICERNNERFLTASIRRAICGELRMEGRYTEAIEVINPAVEIFSESHLEEELATVLNLRGLLYDDLGRHSRAIIDFEASRKVAERVEDRSLQFEAATNFAASFDKRRSPEALEHFRNVIDMVRKWGDPVREASTRNNLGQVLLQLERPGQALEQFQRALRIKIGGEPRGEIITFIGMGDAVEALGRHDEANTFYTMALVPALESGDATLVSMCAGRLDKEETSEARIERLEREIAELRRHGPCHQERIVATRLGQAYFEAGYARKAHEALTTHVPQQPADWLAIDVLPLMVVYGRAMAAMGNVNEAIELFNRLATLIDDEAERVPLGTRRSEIFSHGAEVFDALIELATGTRGSHAETAARACLAFDAHEVAKSRSFLFAIGSSRLRAPAMVPAAKVAEEAELLALETALEGSDGLESEAGRESRILEVHRKLKGCWADMAASAPEYVRMRSGRPINFSEARRIVAGQEVETVLVSFHCTASQTTAFVVRRDRDEPLVVSCEVGREQIRQAASQLRRMFNGDPHQFPPYPPIRGSTPERRNLASVQQICAPLLDFLSVVGNPELICIAGHGPTHMLPFHALRTADDRFLVERAAVAYCPSLSVADRVVQRAGEVPGERSRSVLVAGVASVSDAYPDRFESDDNLFDRSFWAVDAALGPQGASKQHVLANAANYGTVHLSCHGHFEDADPLASGLLLSDGSIRPPADIASIPVIKRPMFLLTARELRKARLEADLVTLSACSTGLQGAVNAGDEFAGLPRSLLLAGTSSVLVTLWNVDQLSSNALYGHFYRTLSSPGSKTPKWRALRQAQLAFLNSDQRVLRHPYHWAPYALIGDWR